MGPAIKVSGSPGSRRPAFSRSVHDAEVTSKEQVFSRAPGGLTHAFVVVLETGFQDGFCMVGSNVGRATLALGVQPPGSKATAPTGRTKCAAQPSRKCRSYLFSEIARARDRSVVSLGGRVLGGYRNAYPIGFASIISIANSISTPAKIPEFAFTIPITFPSGSPTSISSQT